MYVTISTSEKKHIIANSYCTQPNDVDTIYKYDIYIYIQVRYIYIYIYIYIRINILNISIVYIYNDMII